MDYENMGKMPAKTADPVVARRGYLASSRNIETHLAVERRITLRLLAYWEKLRDGRDMPTEEDIDPDYLDDLWDNCFLIHAHDLSKDDYNYTYLGEAIADAYRGDMPEDNPAGMVSPDASKLGGHFARILASGKPLVEEGEFRNLHNDLVKYRQCLLPLGAQGEVKAIFGGMRFKIFPAK